MYWFLKIATFEKHYYIGAHSTKCVRDLSFQNRSVGQSRNFHEIKGIWFFDSKSAAKSISYDLFCANDVLMLFALFLHFLIWKLELNEVVDDLILLSVNLALEPVKCTLQTQIQN